MLRRRREARGLTQEQLAHLIGRTGGVVSEWERGKHSPRRAVLRRVDDVLEAGGEIVAAFYPSSTELERLRADHEALEERVAQLAEQMVRVLRLLAD